VVRMWWTVECRGSRGIPAGRIISENLEQGVKTRVPGEDFNVAAVRSHRSAIDSKFSDVDEVPVSHVDE
jgi:hypothetical protein